MIFALILAGGKGSRMGKTDMPKQFLTLGTQPVIIHTIEQFLNNKKIDKVIVCVPKLWLTHTEEIIGKTILDKNKIEVIEGGINRNDTVLAGCNYIVENYNVTSKDVVITHDAVRPFVTQRIINDNIKASKTYSSIDTAIPCVDTIISSNDGETITSIPERNKMYLGQTPQTFNLKKLLKAFSIVDEKEQDSFTDTCKLMLTNKEKVFIVRGEDFNMKITTQHDFKIANAILEVKNYD